MKALRKLIPALAVVAAMAMMAPAIGLVGRPFVMDDTSGKGTAGIASTGDIRHVANIGDDIGWSGSDIEFASREVVKLAEGATGDPVCETDAEGACLVDENGETIFQTEVRDFAIAGGLSQPGRIIDVTDPENPVHVTNTPCAIYQNDIQIQGDLLLVAADGTGTCKREDGTNAAFAGTAVLDFSDPRNPTYLSRLQYGRGSHNHTFHPTEPLVYLSDSDLASPGLGNIPVWDVSDPAAPTLVTEFGHLVHSPHDITFNADGSRAYVAAVSATYILNTEDPKAPTLISTIANEGISISHQSDPTPDGNYLLVTDELGGGSVPGASPGGPVHIYDIRNESAPVKIGLIENNCLVVACEDGAPVHITTAHVLRINPDGWTMAMGWYEDGVFVMDYSSLIGGNIGPSGESGPLGPRVVASMKMPDANAWAAKMWQERHPGYVFVNDINRGFDVFHAPELAGDFLAFGSLRAANPGPFIGATGVTKNEFETDCDYAPRTQGVDGWVQEIPSSLSDGTHTLTGGAIASPTGEWDLDYYFYDENCTIVGVVEDEAIGVAETVEIPGGTAYVLAVNFFGEPIRIRLTAS